jgi:hypothetical protein
MMEESVQFEQPVQFDASQRSLGGVEDEAPAQSRYDENKIDDLIGRVAAPPHLEATPDQLSLET